VPAPFAAHILEVKELAAGLTGEDSHRRLVACGEQ
jgi:hypothetical protein